MESEFELHNRPNGQRAKNPKKAKVGEGEFGKFMKSVQRTDIPKKEADHQIHTPKT